MKLIWFIISIWVIFSCKRYLDKEITNYDYHDISISDTVATEKLKAVTDEEYLQYGARIAFVNEKNDTIIPFGKFAFYGTDILEYYANVMEHPNDSTYGRQVAIDRDQNVLFDLVMFDNGPEPFHEGLTRVLRNGKMGYANKYGQIVISCDYDFAKRFHNGRAEVTHNAIAYVDLEEHKRVVSDEWLVIDKKGNRIEN